MVKYILKLIIFLFVITLLSCTCVLAGDVSITASTQQEMESKIYSAFENNLSARSNGFNITISGACLQNINLQISGGSLIGFEPAQPYFEITEPFNKFKYSNGNDYLATIFDPTNQPISLGISTGDINMHGITNQIVLDYCINWEETVSQTQYVNSFVSSINAQILTNSMSSYEKIKTMHDYLLNNFSYDFSFNSHSTYYLIKNKIYSCESFSALFYLFLKNAGFDSRIVLKGNSSDTSLALDNDNKKAEHAWNLVNLDGNWYHIDMTWDDNYKKSDHYVYFLKSDATMKSDHFWDESNYPKAPSNYNFTVAPQISTVAVKPTVTKTSPSSTPAVSGITSSQQNPSSEPSSTEVLSSLSVSSTKLQSTNTTPKSGFNLMPILLFSIPIILTCGIIILLIKLKLFIKP